MKIDIETIQVNPVNSVKFVAFLESYGFEWPFDKSEINPAEFPWIIIYINNKEIGGNSYLRDYYSVITDENECKSLIQNNFQKVKVKEKEYVKMGQKYSCGQETYIVAFVNQKLGLVNIESGNVWDSTLWFVDDNYVTLEMLVGDGFETEFSFEKVEGF